MGFPTTVGDIPSGTLIQISVVGTKNEGGGRSTQAVNATTDLLGLIEVYSALKQSAELDMNKVAALTQTGKVAEAISYMAEFQASHAKAGSATLADIIVDAVANFLVKAHGFIESATDPGKPVFYFSRADLSPQWVNGGKSGIFYCLVALTAPFGAL